MATLDKAALTGMLGAPDVRTNTPERGVAVLLIAALATLVLLRGALRGLVP